MVLAVVDDLLFSSKIRAVAARTGCDVVFVRTPADVIPEIARRQPALVIVDLDRDALNPAELIRAIRNDPATAATRIVGFVSHVHAERIQAAREAGADSVLARSAFVATLPDLLAAANRPAS